MTEPTRQPPRGPRVVSLVAGVLMIGAAFHQISAGNALTAYFATVIAGMSFWHARTLLTREDAHSRTGDLLAVAILFGSFGMLLLARYGSDKEGPLVPTALAIIFGILSLLLAYVLFGLWRRGRADARKPRE